MSVSRRRFRGSLVALCLPFLLPAASATAAPTTDVVIERADDLAGASFSPGTRTLAEVANGYVEEEFLVSGSADLYSYGHNPPLGPTDIVMVDEGVAYQTRMIVRRPASAGDFNGTVVIEWWNSTAGFDSGPVWDTSAEYFGREGIIYVGVTNSATAIDFLADGCRLFGVLPPSCGERYATLSLLENGFAYDMMSQIAHRLKSSGFSTPLPATFDVERVFHAGQSQQGGSIVTYASAFHFEDNDGYFIQQAATARSINSLPACARLGPFHVNQALGRCSVSRVASRSRRFACLVIARGVCKKIASVRKSLIWCRGIHSRASSTRAMRKASS